mgnify:CR=1 FL=1
MRGAGRLRSAAVTVAAGALFAGGNVAWATGEAPAVSPSEAASWDQVESIRGAAERLGRLHRAKGAKAAYELIDNCYRTHSLASTYGEGFEACIVQDYLETRTLIQVYARMPPETLEKHGVPSPAMLADSMGKRVSMAFGQYGKSQAYADNVKRIVDEHGLPVFLAIVFPEAMKAIQDKQENDRTKKQPR